MDTEAYLTLGEVAQRLRVDESTVRRWIRTGALEAETIKLCRKNRHHIKKSVVDVIEQRDPEYHRKLV